MNDLSFLDGYAKDAFLFVAHHVHNHQCAPATRPHHNPVRHNVALKIAELAHFFNNLGIPTLRTELHDDEIWGMNDQEREETYGAPGNLSKACSHRGSGGYRDPRHASAFFSYMADDIKNNPVKILTGFNTTSCILETVLDEQRPSNDVLIVLRDAIVDSWVYNPEQNKLSPEEAIQKMEDAGAIILESSALVNYMKKRFEPTPGGR